MSKRRTKTYKSVSDLVVGLTDLIQPPERLTVSQAAEKYRFVNQPGSYVGPWLNSTSPYMVEPMDTFASAEYSGMVFVGPAQCGKALAINTPIATPTGWTTMGELRPGDEVFDEQGRVCRVTFATPVMYGHDCYEITFDDGTTIVADAEHRWVVYDDVRERSRTVDTSEIAETFKYGARKQRNRYAIKNARPLKLPEANLPIDPYVLGVWLGDGHAYSNHICVGEGDIQIADYVREAGYQVEVVKDPGQRSFTIKVDPTNGEHVTGSFRDTLRRVGLLHEPNWQPGKFIPPQYQRASIEQRRALLQGLNDTDGTVSANGVVSFSTSEAGLAEDYRMLCASLGIKTVLRKKLPKYTYNGEVREGKVSYIITSMPRQSDRPFRLQRHLDRVRGDQEGRPSHTGRRRIVNVERVESVPVRCIQVDSPSHLYLAGRQMVPTHNTDALIINTLLYSVKVDPLDMMIVLPSMYEARDFSMRRIDRLHRHSPAVGDLLLPGSNNDNTFDKHYSNGMLLTLTWPTASTLAGKPIPRVVITDRDRMDDDIDGEGEVFDLAAKRTTTFGSYAMTVVESSPSRPVDNPKWIPSIPHEAPPCSGILSLYNRGDRRRWYWPCPNCERYFEATFDMLVYEDWPDATNLERAETVRLVCPTCGHKIHPDDREEMQEWGIWLKGGQSIDAKGRVFGPTPRTTIASFWLRGLAAAFSNWKKLVATYLDAQDAYDRTNSEEALVKFYNTDLGEPYLPKALSEMRLPETLKARAEKLPERKVPEGVRFLVATVDVQTNMFVVQVFGILPGKPFDMVVIDRFDVRNSQRIDDSGNALWVKPHAYLEDWDELIDNVLHKVYPLGDDSGRVMQIKMVGCDSGGKKGATTMAYNFYRKLRDENLHRRFILLKGDPSPNQPRARITYPDSNRRDSKAGARGDIPLLMLNSNMLKDDLNGRLDCLEPGKGMFRTPDWLSDSFYAELCAEVREAKGWTKVSPRNEGWDLAYYCIGLCVSELIRVEHIDWSNPPSWADEWDNNDLVRHEEDESRFANEDKSMYDFSIFAKTLA